MTDREIFQCDRCGTEFDEDPMAVNVRVVDGPNGENRAEILCQQCADDEEIT